jgi:hypothetical protein
MGPMPVDLPLGLCFSQLNGPAGLSNFLTLDFKSTFSLINYSSLHTKETTNNQTVHGVG